MDLEVFLEKYKDPKEGQIWAGSLGVYVVSPKCPAGFSRVEQCDEFPKKVKIGKTLGQSGFKGRLSTYKTYWPIGLRVWSILRVDSYDPKYHTYRDLATPRETALKRSLEKSRGFEKYRKGSQSEWVRLEPGQVLKHLEAVARPGDEVYSCLGDECRIIKPRGMPGVPLTRRGAIASPNKSLALGDRGLPRVRTRRAIRLAGDIDHPEQVGMFARLEKQQEDLDQKRATLALRMDSAERRKQRRALEAAERRVQKSLVRTRQQTRSLARAAERARTKRTQPRTGRAEPRDLAALRPNRGYLGPTASPVRRPRRGQAGQARGAVGKSRSPTQLVRRLRGQRRLERAIANDAKDRGLDYERARAPNRSWTTAELEPKRFIGPVLPRRRPDRRRPDP